MSGRSSQCNETSFILRSKNFKNNHVEAGDPGYRHLAEGCHATASWTIKSQVVVQSLDKISESILDQSVGLVLNYFITKNPSLNRI